MFCSKEPSSLQQLNKAYMKSKFMSCLFLQSHLNRPVKVQHQSISRGSIEVEILTLVFYAWSVIQSHPNVTLQPPRLWKMMNILCSDILIIIAMYYIYRIWSTYGAGHRIMCVGWCLSALINKTTAGRPNLIQSDPPSLTVSVQPDFSGRWSHI